MISALCCHYCRRSTHSILYNIVNQTVVRAKASVVASKTGERRTSLERLTIHSHCIGSHSKGQSNSYKDTIMFLS